MSVTGRSAEACPQAPNGRAFLGLAPLVGGLDAEASSIACPVSDQPCLVALIFLSVANVPSSFPPPTTPEIVPAPLKQKTIDASGFEKVHGKTVRPSTAELETVQQAAVDNCGKVLGLSAKKLEQATAVLREHPGDPGAALRALGAPLLGALDATLSAARSVTGNGEALRASFTAIEAAHAEWRGALVAGVGQRTVDGTLSEETFRAIGKMRAGIDSRMSALRVEATRLGLSTAVEAKPATEAARIDAALARINAPSFDPARLKGWMAQFDPADRAVALEALEQIDFHTLSDVKKDVRDAHALLSAALTRDGFTSGKPGELFDNVDFSSLYAAKSGAFVGYLYRNENKIRSSCFKTLDGLGASNTPKSDRALVIVEDYTGTGVQFLFEGYATKYRDLMSQYKKIYFVPLVAHENAAAKFKELPEGRGKQVGDAINTEYGIERPELAAQIVSAMESLSSSKLELVTPKVEVPITSPANTRATPEQRARIGAFLDKYKVYKYPRGIGGAEGSTAFFFKPPNTLPEIFWTVKGSRDGEPWKPLFQRTDDVSEYSTAKYYAPGAQVWG